jgi:hypothetical protein
MTQEDNYEAAVRMFRIIQCANRALKSRNPKEISAVKKKIATYDQRLMNHATGKAFKQQALCLDFVARLFEDSLTTPHTSLNKQGVFDAMRCEMPMVASVASLVKQNIPLSSETAKVMTALGAGLSQEDHDQAA